MINKIWAYTRISQYDPDNDLPLEEIQSVRAQTCLRLAEQNGVELPQDHILFETVSGARIDNRPDMQRILELCNRGEVTHLISPEQSRILRGDKRDEATIEECFINNNVTLITADGVTDFGDENYDPLPFEVRALVARYERLRTSKRRKEANKSRLQQNKRSVARPPYGYKRLIAPDRAPTQEDVLSGMAAPDANGNLAWYAYTAVPGEYEIIEEIMRRYQNGETASGIMENLNARGIHPPGYGKGYKGNATRWWYQTMRSIIMNPLFAGYHAKITNTGIGTHNAHTGPDKYILAPTRGHWPQPITLEQWYRIRDRFVNQRNKRGNVYPTMHPLSQILYCSNGELMRLHSGTQYRCYCAASGHPHQGQLCSAVRLEAYLRDLVVCILKQIPDSALKPRPLELKSRAVRMRQAEARYSVLQKQLAEAYNERDDLMRHRSNHIKWFGQSAYDVTCTRVVKVITSAEEESANIKAAMAEPDYTDVLPLLVQIKTLGPEKLWDIAPRPLRRQITHALIQRMQMHPVPPGRKNHVGVTVTVQPDWASYVTEFPPYAVRRYLKIYKPKNP